MPTSPATPQFAVRLVDAGPALSPPKTLDPGVKLVGAGRRMQLPGTGRDGAAVGAPVQVSADELVRIEYHSGAVLWTRADELLREQGRPAAGARGAGARTAGTTGTTVWEIDPRPPGRRAASRGFLTVGIKVLEFFGVDVTGSTTRKLAEALEERQLKGVAPGLYRWPLKDLQAGQALALAPVALVNGKADLPTDRPVLVFLHGTMSSARGSFGALEGADADAVAAREALIQAYGKHIYAFEHRSLTESPITNALAFASQLPVGVQLHLVSHSRGGLVGELLCLAERERGDDPLQDSLIAPLFAQDRTPAQQLGLAPLTADEAKARADAYAADAQTLRHLIAVLDSARPQVRRFVRVACPARGTTLASGRLDRWLSVIDLLNLGGLFSDAADFLLAVIKRRTDPRTLPGIEAMMPGSALTLLLHRPGLLTRSDLSVVAGDIEGEGLFGRLKVQVADWFFDADHDLVVNTGSMSGGLRRPPGGARFQLDAGKDVTHFRYFTNPKSLRWMLAGLARADGADGGFQPIALAPADSPRARAAMQRSRAAADVAPRPIVVLVPGTMGSALNATGRAVWLNYWALLRGGLADIAIDAADVQPTDLLDDFYGPLIEHLARAHRVEVHPYDWRRSVRDAAATLTSQLEALLPEAERTRQPLHIVAHSMGGLVARSMIADGGAGSAVWRRMAALPSSRLLMLGTPNHGSHEAVRWLTGFNASQTKLTLLDLTHGTDAIIDIVRGFPGLVELLPFEQGQSPWGALPRWKKLKADTALGFPLVGEAVLREAARTWALLAQAAPEPARMLYVAGCQPATVVDHELVPSETGGARQLFDWIASAEGDGTVPWASGRLPGVPMYYAPDTGHDELCSRSQDLRIFRGYVDLITHGRTDQLSSTAPASRSAADVAEGRPATFRLPRQAVADSLPDEAALRALSFSGAPRRAQGPALSQTIKLSITHGDLSYASHAVLVGHYVGDTIVSAERVLDDRLGRALSRRQALDLYPGAHGSHAVFWNAIPARMPACAVVIGLGQVGELTASRLETAARDAMLEQINEWLQRPGGNGAAAPAAPQRYVAKFSSLLIGTGANSLRVRDSIEAILRGAVAANRTLEAAHLDDKVLIGEVEFVELQEDIAIAAARDLEAVLQVQELAAALEWAPRTVHEGPGRRKRRHIAYDTSWDQRIEIKEEPESNRLRFIATTDRARAEETLASGQLRLADAFIAKACASTAADSEVAKTLFEMLLPVGLKESAPDQRGLVLLLDGNAARFPWELLEDRWGRNGRPPAISGGIVRQLKTDTFRERPAHTPDRSVLVVGNPDLEGWERFDELPGARDEGKAVAQAFRDQGWFANDLIDKNALDIVNGLHGRAWRVLHLAGHGEHGFEQDRDGKPISGMVIGRDAFLTPGDVQQMRYVPELVFINCCYLGKTGARADPKYTLLAANLGEQFIRMGVRVVVAAGWAVDDGAALTFARTFYAELFAGHAFREAVRRAREEAFTSHGGTNTWGAYQCYGDPGWRLVRQDPDGGARTPEPYVSPRELLADLDNEYESARVQYRRAEEDIKTVAARSAARAKAMQQRIPPAQRSAWLARGDVAAGFGFVYGEASMFDEAIDYLERALAAAEGDCPVRAAEECANFRIRQVTERWRVQRAGRGPDDSEGMASLVKTVKQTIRELDKINERAETPNRLMLLGSACKRLALIQPVPALRTKALLEMAQYYRRAYDLCTADPQHRDRVTQALTNWAVACLLLEPLDPQRAAGNWHGALAAQVARQMESDAERYRQQPALWLALGQGDLALVQMLLARGPEEVCNAQAERIAVAYENGFAGGVSSRHIGSLADHLDFLIDMTSGGAAGAAGAWPQPVRDGLAAVRQRIAAMG